MIKQLKLTEVDKKRIEAWLSDEITTAQQDRSDLETRWMKWNDQGEAKPETEVKNFPWEKASNIVIPMQAITVNSFVARQYNTIIHSSPFWTVHALNEKWVDHALPTQNLLEYSQRYEMKMNQNMIPWLYNTAHMGTGFVKVVWVSESIDDKRYNDKGDVTKTTLQLSDGPRFIPINIEDVLFQVNSVQDLQKTQWVAHRFRLLWYQVQQRGNTKIPETGESIYQDIDEIEKDYQNISNQQTDKKEDAEKLNRSNIPREHEFFEVWCDYDYDDDGTVEKCCFTVHNSASSDERASCKLVRAILNPWAHRMRPIFGTQCFPRANRIYGIGFGQKHERLQQAISDMANQAINNAVIANARMFKYKKGSGIKAPFKIYPGKGIPVSDMGDLETFQFGDIYPSGNLIINFLRDIIEHDVGVSSYQSGRESPVIGTRATATSTLALIQEGTKIFDFILQNQRNTLNEVAYINYSLYAQMKPAGLVNNILGNDGHFVEETWKSKEEDVRRNMQFDLTASSAYVNKAVERQSWMDMFSLLVGYYTKMFEMGELVANPQFPVQLKAYAGKVIESSKNVLDRILGMWDVKDKDRVLANPEDLISLAMSQPQQQPLEGGVPGGTNQGGATGTPNANAVPGMGGLPQNPYGLA